MAEGIAQVHRMNAAAVESHVRELRWLEPDRAAGVLRSFFAEQRADGSLPSLIYPNHISGTDAGSANWGSAMLALDVMSHRSALSYELYPRLAADGEWLLRSRGGKTPSDASVRAVASDVYAYQLWRALERLALRADDRDAAEKWRKVRERSAAEMLEHMWDSERGIFLDVDATSGARIPIDAVTGFYPFMTDIVRAEHVQGMERSLLDPNRFWTPFPVPTRAIDDPEFSPSAEVSVSGNSRAYAGRVRPFTVARRPRTSGVMSAGRTVDSTRPRPSSPWQFTHGTIAAENGVPSSPMAAVIARSEGDVPWR
jgi:hypothetical protein